MVRTNLRRKRNPKIEKLSNARFSWTIIYFSWKIFESLFSTTVVDGVVSRNDYESNASAFLQFLMNRWETKDSSFIERAIECEKNAERTFEHFWTNGRHCCYFLQQEEILKFREIMMCENDSFLLRAETKFERYIVHLRCNMIKPKPFSTNVHTTFLVIFFWKFLTQKIFFHHSNSPQLLILCMSFWKRIMKGINKA